MKRKFVCRVCFRNYESEEFAPSCPHCHNEPEESYRLDSEIVTVFLRVMGRSDTETERLKVIREVLQTDWNFAVKIGALRKGSTMSGWICPRDRHVVEQVLLNYPSESPVVLEVGVAGGGCSNTILLARPDCLFIGIDDWSADARYEKDFLDNTYPFKSRVELVTGDSRDVGRGWNRELDVLLIDGGHEYDVVSADIINFVPWVKKGGVIMLDDYNCLSVKAAVDERLTPLHGFELVRMPDSQFGMAEKLIVYRRRES